MNDVKDIRRNSVDAGIDSFSDIVMQYQQRVFQTCFSFLRNREDAEDIAQEVFLEVYKSYDRFRGDSLISTWIYRITVNRCMDYLRMKNRKKRNLFAFKNVGSFELERIDIKTNSHPQCLLEEKERNQLIQSAIDALPERQKVAFTLAKIDGMKQEDIAQIMNTTVSSVESLLIRAKKKLKDQLYKAIKQHL